MTNETIATEKTGEGAASAPVTVSHLLGEMAWLLTQSALHRELRLGDLEWLVMPPLIHRQFYIFRSGDQPVGVALWAECNEAAERKLQGDLMEPANKLSLQDWKSGDRLWLVDLVAPFANDQNKQRQVMIADLVSGPLAGREFRLHRTDEKGGRAVQVVEADTGRKLQEAVAAARGSET